ncbi:hypothetical protein ACJIZ3_004949 [Penstemon smallii]|uniref:Enhancer of polycomb-like transcription factor protein n=1 Tax=Penstemon smallii TaxID=265156 RepID=A0ABD3S3H2_9LAMI
MESSRKKSSGVEISKRNRSSDVKSLYKSRVSEVGDSKKKLSEINDLEDIEKKKRKSRKEVSLSSFERDVKKVKKEDVSDVKLDTGSCKTLNGGIRNLHAISLALGDNASVFNVPKRPRGSVGRKKPETDQHSKPPGLPDSDCVGLINASVTKCEDDSGPNDDGISGGNDGISHLKLAGKVSRSNSKSKQKSDSKSTCNARGLISASGTKSGEDSGPNDCLGKLVSISGVNDGILNSKPEGKFIDISGGNDGISNSKPTGKCVRSNLKSKQKEDSKSTSNVRGLINASVAKSVDESGPNDQLVNLVAILGGNDGISSSKPAGSGNSKSKKKADPKSTCNAKGLVNASVTKSDDDTGPGDRLGKFVAISGGNDSIPNSKPAGKGSYSNSKSKQREDSKLTCNASSASLILKRKAVAGEVKGRRNSRTGSVLHAEEKENLVKINEDRYSKKRRRNDKKEKDFVVDIDGSKGSTKKTEPSVGSSVSDSLFVDFLDDDDDDDDEENLEQNAARMLSSRFDPSCTGFLSKKKTSISQTTDRFSFQVPSARVSSSQQANSSGGVESASADDNNRALRPRREDKGKGVSRKRRHFYEIIPKDVDAYWVLNRRIKVFWPLDDSWYQGLVNDYHPESKLHHIEYDDRDEEWVYLQEEKFKLLLLPCEVPGKSKSKKRKTRNKDVQQVKSVPPSDDDSCIGDYLDSEPIASWLSRSTQRVKSLPKSLKKQRTVQMHLADSSLSSEKTENSHSNSNVSDSHTVTSKTDCECALADDLVVDGGIDKSLLGTTENSPNCKKIVYVRKTHYKKSKGSSFRSVNVEASPAPRTVTSLIPENHLWSIDNKGELRLNVMMVSKEFRFQICLPILPFLDFSRGTKDFWVLHNILMLQHGALMTTSRAVKLDMLFIDSNHGLRFLLFEGCLKQALVFVFLILVVFSQPDEQWNSDMQLPVTSVRFRLSSVQDLRKRHIFAFYSFSRLQNSKLSKLLQQCLLVKQLPVSECTYDNIKDLDCGSSQQFKINVDLEPSAFEGCKTKFGQGVVPMSVSREACDIRMTKSQFSLSFSAAPTFFLSLHLQLLMAQSSEQDLGTNVMASNFVAKVDSSQNLQKKNQDSAGSESSLEVIVQSGNHESINEVHEQGIVSSPPYTLTSVDPTSNPMCDSTSGGMIVDIPSSDQGDMPSMGKGCISRQTSKMGRNVNDGSVYNPNPTSSRSPWKHGRRSSISSLLRDLSPVWSNGKTNLMHDGFSIGPKKPRTQVQYTLPVAGYGFSTKQKMENLRDLPCKRIRRASLKRISDGFRTNQKEMDFISCIANVLVTHGDKGWKECGAHVVLEVADRNEWRLAVKLSGITKYSCNVKHILQPGSTNRYSHAMMWKGGKDWVLEFPDRSQWTLFKEMHEECYNRNIRAATVKNIPIPGVWQIEENDYGTEVPFVRNSAKYFRQVQTDVEMAMDPSHVFYDLDSDDEQWLIENKRCGDISEEILEKTIDMYEKVSYIKKRDKLTDAEIEELVAGIRSVEVSKVIYEHWRHKRERKGMPLIRHLQPPLWQRYQQQLKEWEHTVARGSGAFSVGSQEKAPPPEKPPMFAFCMKPRGFDVPNKGSKQRSHRKFHHTASGDPEGFLTLGRRSNGHALGDEKVLYPITVHGYSDVSPSPQASTRGSSPVDAHFYKHKKFGSYPSSNNQHIMSYNKSRKMNHRNVVQQWNMGLPEFSSQKHHFLEGQHRESAELLDGSVLHEFQLRDASGAAKHALKMAKLKRDKARRLLYRADLVVHKAVVAIMTAEAMETAHEISNGHN